LEHLAEAVNGEASPGHEKSRKPGRRKNAKWLVYLGVCLLSAFTVMFVEAFIELNAGKLKRLKEDLTGHYYSAEKLEALMKEKLGDSYLGDPDEDFEHYVIALVMEQLRSVEDEKFKPYNAFLSRERFDEILEGMKKAAGDVTGRALDADTYLLELTGFYDGVTLKNVRKHLDAMRNYGNLIIDLRNNAGGSIEEAGKTAELFLEKGRIIFQTVYARKTKTVVSKNEDPLRFDRIVLLTNGGTASAAELFVLSLRENLPEAVVIGTRTHGKPFAVAIRKFDDGTGMMFINGEMRGPNLSRIDADGIEPDVSADSADALQEAFQFLASR